MARATGCRVRVVACPQVAIDADAAWAADLNRLAAAGGITLVHLSERPRRLEEAFFALTGGANGDGGAGAARGAR